MHAAPFKQVDPGKALIAHRRGPLHHRDQRDLEGYGCLVDDPDTFDIEISAGPRRAGGLIDAGTGDEGGYVEGTFRCDWRGDVLYGVNEAVNGDYVLGWTADPQQASTTMQTRPRDRVLLWHMNYHPDGGQLFFPIEKKPFIVPAALPGDDLKPENIVVFWSDGSKGIYIHPSIWHEGVFPVTDSQSFRDRQGRVHARVSLRLRPGVRRLCRRADEPQGLTCQCPSAVAADADIGRDCKTNPMEDRMSNFYVPLTGGVRGLQQALKNGLLQIDPTRLAATAQASSRKGGCRCHRRGSTTRFL